MRYSTRRNIPVEVVFAASDITSVTLYGPDAEIARTAPAVHGDAKCRYAVVTPTELGLWRLVTATAGGEVTAEVEIECRRALPHESTYEGLVAIWPAKILDGTPSGWVPMGGQSSRAFVNTGKLVCGADDTIWGCWIYAAAGITEATSLRFFTLDSASGGHVRSVSDNLRLLTPTTGTWGVEGWLELRFGKAVHCRHRDLFGLEIVGATGDHLGVQPGISAHTNSAIFARNGALSLVDPLTFSSAVAAPSMLACQPIISPIDAALAGHSIPAGHGLGTESPNRTVFEPGDDYPLNERDLGGRLSALTGWRWYNVCDGGTNLALWDPPVEIVPTGGLFDANVAPLRPRRVYYDSLCNEAGTADTLRQRLQILQALCFEIDAELVVIEAPPVESKMWSDGGTVPTPAIADAYTSFRATVEEWCVENGVQLVPTLHALGESSGQATQFAAKRDQPVGKRAGSQWLAYGRDPYGSADHTHLSQSGQQALGNLIARGVRAERGGAAKPAMAAACAIAGVTAVAGDVQTIYAADGVTPLLQVTVSGAVRGYRTASALLL